MEDKPKFPTKRKRKLIEEHNPSLKISRITSKDGFFDLPNAIIQHILSFCTVEDAVKFCSLSRHWISLWTSVSNLSFLCCKRQNITHFALFVDKALSLYSAPKVKTLLLQFRYDRRFKERVKSWICFSLTHGVEELYLHFIGLGALGSSEVSVWFGNWCGTSLKVISLARLLLDIEMIEAILRGSPLLECLKLQQCYLIESLGSNFLIDAANTRLKTLALDGCSWVKYDYQYEMADLCEGLVEIRGPDLLSLTLIGDMWETILKLADVSSLVEANIDFALRAYKDKDKLERMVCLPVKAVFEKLLHVNKLEIGDEFFQVLRNMSLDGENFSPPLGAKFWK